MLAAFMLYATVLAVVIGVLAVLMERAAAQLRWPRRWVWLIAMVAMVLMPTVMRLTTHREPSANDRIVPPVSVSRIAPNLPDAAPETLPQALPQALRVNAPAAVTKQPVRVPPESMTAHWQRVLDRLIERTAAADHLLLYVWALLTGGLAIRVGRGLWRLRILPRSLEQRSVQGTTVYLTENLGPAVIGGTWSAIVLPRWVLQLDHVLLTLVLQHEREHVKARDSRVLAIGLVLLVLVPWHAPLWWAWRRLRLAIEVDCDARVLRADGNVKRYAQLLLLMSQQRRVQGPVSFGDALTSPLLLAFNPQFHHLTQRINAMTARPSKHPLRLLTIGLASAAMATLAVAIPAPPKVAVASAPIRALTGRPREAVQIIPARHVVLSKRGVGVAETASPLAPATQWDSLAARRSSLELQRVRVLMTYEPRFARLQEIDRKFADLDDALQALPSGSAWNVLERVTRALGARTEVLLAERQRLSAGGKRFTTEFAAIDAEIDLLRQRTLALRRLQAQWRPPLKPYAMRSVVSEAEAAAQSSRAPAPSLKR